MTRDDQSRRRRPPAWPPRGRRDDEGPDLAALRDGLIDRAFETSPSLAAALLFAYWMFMASAAIVTFGWGSLFASLIGTLVLLALTAGLVFAYREARLRAEADEVWRLGALLLSIPALCFVAATLLLPVMVVIILATYLLTSLPMALLR